MSTAFRDDQQAVQAASSSTPYGGHSRSHSNGHGANFDQANVVAFIGHGVEFSGVIKYHGSVRVDGRLDGEVHAEGTLYLGEQAVITAKITAQSVISKGQITGDIKAKEKVQLLAPAKMDGSVKTPSLLMEEGVLFNGTCEMGPQKGKDGKVKDTRHQEEPAFVSVSEALSPA